MRRCETLVATREDLTKMRDRIKATISEEEESLAQFKEEQNERILELRYVPYYSMTTNTYQRYIPEATDLCSENCQTQSFIMCG